MDGLSFKSALSPSFGQAEEPNLPPADPMVDAAARSEVVTMFDLDRTLTRRGTWTPFLLFVCARSAPWRLLLVPAVIAAMIAYKFGMIDRKRLKQWMQRLLLGARVRRARIEALADAFADRIIATGLHSEVPLLIATEQERGHILILATAAHRFYAAAIAKRLGIAHVVATESEWRGDELLARIVGENCYGAAKAEALFRYLEGLGIERSAIHMRCYTDDRSDLPCLEASDERFVVNPKPAMARLSIAHNWPILHFH